MNKGHDSEGWTCGGIAFGVYEFLSVRGLFREKKHAERGGGKPKRIVGEASLLWNEMGQNTHAGEVKLECHPPTQKGGGLKGKKKGTMSFSTSERRKNRGKKEDP